jgi:hypothetical protein
MKVMNPSQLAPPWPEITSDYKCLEAICCTALLQYSTNLAVISSFGTSLSKTELRHFNAAFLDSVNQEV